MSEAKAALRGGVFFIAWFLGGLMVLYGMSPQLSTQPFVRIMLSNAGWSYFDFVGFWWWFIIVPILFSWYVIRPVGQNHKGGFHH